ncbi:MAG: enoyl-ACP reductase [Deltaproteobacteria bacterium]|nr:enoyl-ACP reductase [Deltaproteobacteria bacterium]
MTSSDSTPRRAAVFGVANDHSIAWAIAQRLHADGVELALTYPNDSIEKRVRPLAESLGVDCVLPCDVTDDAQIEAAFAALRERWGTMDALVHSLAFANRDDLKGRFVETSRMGFHLALDVSAYSLVAMARAAEPLLAPRRGAIVTLTYLGGERVVPNYNVMGVAKAALEASVRYLAWDLGGVGIRVNAISAGPLRTLSSAGISGFRTMLGHQAEYSPLRRNISTEEVAATAAFLCSPAAAGITAEVVHVDAGYHVMGM